MTANREAGQAGGSPFPTTRGSVLVGARSSDPDERARSFEVIVAAYWRPVYKYIRVRFNRSNEDAMDLTQGFFLRSMQKDFFAPYDPARGRFRTFLRTCLDGYLANEHKAEKRLKRGGDVVFLPLEFETAEGELARTEIPSPETIERFFDAEWARSLFGIALDALRSECRARGKEIHFALFELYDIDAVEGARPTYDELAGRFRIPATSVTNYLAWARREFRRIVLAELRALTGSDEEFRKEARFLLGTEPE
jgi:RNA polymerase sigma factor (sigma-70 family)